LTASETLQQSDGTGLLVVDATCEGEPTKGDLVGLWKKRSGGGVAPVLVVARYVVGGEPVASLLGLDEDSVPVGPVPVDLAIRIVSDALNETSPSRLDAEFRRRVVSAAGGGGAGLRNEGLLATHVLDRVPDGEAWAGLGEAGLPLLSKRGRGLLEGLGYTVEGVVDGTILREKTGGHRRAAAVLLNDGETFENPLVRLAGVSAVSHGLAVARRESVDWLVVVGGAVLRLYPVSPDVGVGRKGQTQTYVELDLGLLPDDLAGYLPLLFAPDALAKGGYLDTLLGESSRFATDLAERLRDRIYQDVIPGLAVAVAARFDLVGKSREEQRAILDEAYHQAMIVLFRLLFVAYAEDRGLLPFGTSERYTRNALKTLAQDMATHPGERFSAESTTLWDDLTQVWKVIDTGDLEGWGVPPYNGGLFTRDPVKNPSGAATYDLELTNGEIGPVLRGLLIDRNNDDVLGPVDFRSLSVREFGTIYEGLLESNLGVAEVDLALDGDEYVPAGKKDPVEVHAGEAYFHSKSGSRKATGSYFTKPFAVEHLLNTALEPALDEHLARVKSLLDAGKYKDAAAALFDFRVTDLSMGSAHFLVAAVDRIEVRFSGFIDANPMPEVRSELDGLRVAAAARLGVDPAESGIDDAMLLRRLIARRCIYGVDINEIAVELARLAMWIHTFVPGLPLSFLNHSLIRGNSLTGVATVDEISVALQEAEERETKASGQGNSMLLDMALEEFIGRSREQLDRLAALTDASVADVATASAMQDEITSALQPLEDLCNLITAERATRHLGIATREESVYDARQRRQVTLKVREPHPDRVLISANPGIFEAVDAEGLRQAVLNHPHLIRARDIAREVAAIHLPVAYPEVFRRDPAGFDVVLGNPPWKELTVEELQFWSIRFPGLKYIAGEEQRARIQQHRAERPDLVEDYQSELAQMAVVRQVLTSGPYPGIGVGDPDVYKAFAWRQWNVCRLEGRIGVLLPRSIWTTKGASEWRLTALRQAESLVDLTRNTGGWMFDEVNPGWQITFLAMHRGGEVGRIGIRGEFTSLDEFRLGITNDAHALTTSTILANDPDLCLPALNDANSLALYGLLMAQPGLSDGRVPPFRTDFRCAPAAEIHATNDGVKGDALFTGNPADAPVYNHLNVDAFAFNESAGVFNYADRGTVTTWLLRGRSSTYGNKKSPFTLRNAAWAADDSTLPALNPRLVFRDVVHASNKRKVWFALAPAGVFLTNKAPYLVFSDDNTVRDAYVLGVLNSACVDFVGHLRVGLNLNFFILYGLPVPTFDPTDERVQRIAALSAGLAVRPGFDYGDWSEIAVGVPDRASARAEIDALVTRLFRIPDVLLPTLFPEGNETRSRISDVVAWREQWTA
jgi:hypothetical protein